MHPARHAARTRRRAFVGICVCVTVLRAAVLASLILGALSIAAMRLQWSVHRMLVIFGLMLLAAALWYGCVYTCGQVLNENCWGRCRTRVWYWCPCGALTLREAILEHAPLALAFVLGGRGTPLTADDGESLIRQAAEMERMRRNRMRPAVWKAERLACLQLVAAARSVPASSDPLLSEDEVRALLEAATHDNDMQLMDWCLQQEPAAIQRLAEEGADLVAACASTCDEEGLAWFLRNSGESEVRRRGPGDPRHLQALEAAVHGETGDRTAKVAALLALPLVRGHPNLATVLPAAAAAADLKNAYEANLDEHQCTWFGWWCGNWIALLPPAAPDPLAQLLPLCSGATVAVDRDGVSLFHVASGPAFRNLAAADPTWLARVPLADARGSSRLGRWFKGRNLLRHGREHGLQEYWDDSWSEADLADMVRARPSVLSLPCEVLFGDGEDAGRRGGRGGRAGPRHDDHAWLWSLLRRVQVARFGASDDVEERTAALRSGTTPLALALLSHVSLDEAPQPVAHDVLRLPPLLYLLAAMAFLAAPSSIEALRRGVLMPRYIAEYQALPWLAAVLRLPHDLTQRPRPTPAAPWPVNLMLVLLQVLPRAMSTVPATVYDVAEFGHWGVKFPHRLLPAEGVLEAWLASVREGAWGRRSFAVTATAARHWP